MADAGAPDGFMGGIMVRASSRWHLHAGAGHNTMSIGTRAGLRADLLTTTVSPFAAFEIGYYGQGQPQPWVQAIAEHAGLDNVEVEKLSYRFANAHVGLRLRDAGATFFIQGGASHVRSTIFVREMRVSNDPAAPTIDIRAHSVLSGWVPSARLGFILAF